MLGRVSRYFFHALAASRQLQRGASRVGMREPAGFFVRLDMESSHYTEITLEIFETLWQQGQRGLGVVLQSALRRSEQDLQRINALGGRIRLVKGAYTEPNTIAYRKKADVDA